MFAGQRADSPSLSPIPLRKQGPVPGQFTRRRDSPTLSALPQASGGGSGGGVGNATIHRASPTLRGPSLEPLPRPDSVASELAKSLERNPRTIRRYYFSPNGLDKRSERLPAARHYDVVLEEGDGTEGPNLVDEIHCRYVDFLKLTEDASLGEVSAAITDVTQIARFLDRCRPRTRLDGYPLYVILKDILRRMLDDKISSATRAEARLRAEVASLQASLEAAAEARAALASQSQELRDKLRKITTQLHMLGAKEAHLKEQLHAHSSELELAATAHLESTSKQLQAAEATEGPGLGRTGSGDWASLGVGGDGSGVPGAGEKSLHETVNALPEPELNSLISQLPPSAVESLMMAALEGGPGGSELAEGLFRALLASGTLSTDAILSALSSLPAERRRELLRKLWAELAGPNDRCTVDTLESLIGIGPDDLARMIAAEWESWGSSFLLSLLHRVGGEPAELLQEIMSKLAPRRAMATSAMVEMSADMREGLADATDSVATAFESSWGSGSVMGRDATAALSELQQSSAELEEAGVDGGTMGWKALQATIRTLELGESANSDALASAVAAGDAVGVARWLMRSVCCGKIATPSRLVALPASLTHQHHHVRARWRRPLGPRGRRRDALARGLRRRLLPARRGVARDGGR